MAAVQELRVSSSTTTTGWAPLRWFVLASVLAALVRPMAAPAAAVPTPPEYKPDPVPPPLLEDFTRNKYSLDAKSGNYLSPKVFAKTVKETLVPVLINGNYVKDLKGKPIFLRESIRDKLLKADAAMFEQKKKHLAINYGFRSNALQRELYDKLHGKGAVAPPGGSFHETGMALDLNNWHDAQRFMIEGGFVGGCYGIEEDLVHYSIGEVTKASNAEAFKRCTLKEIPDYILKGSKKAGETTVGVFKNPGSLFKKNKKKDDNP